MAISCLMIKGLFGSDPLPSPPSKKKKKKKKKKKERKKEKKKRKKRKNIKETYKFLNDFNCCFIIASILVI